MLITGYHGTEKAIEKEITSNLKIFQYLASEQSMKKNRNQTNTGKSPGSLGYGFYVFGEDVELARSYAKRMCTNPTILEVKLDLSDVSILNFDSYADQIMYHNFRSSYKPNAKLVYDRFQSNGYNIKQHILDGIIIEAYIKRLKSKKGFNTQVVRLSTYTVADKNETLHDFSFIPNGVEYCIKDKSIIKGVVPLNC